MNAKRTPPPGPPWDLPMESAPLAFIDLEMTGLDDQNDRVIQVCIERVVGEELVDRFVSFVRPTPPVSLTPSVHGIESEDLAEAPTFAEIVPRIAALTDGTILVAHAARYDVAFLAAEHQRAQLPFEAPLYLDTLALSRRAFALPTHQLSALAETFDIPNPQPHRADNDVAVLRGLFARVLEELKPQTPRDLWHVRVGRREARPEIIAAAQRAATDGAPVCIRYRPASRRVQTISFVVTSVISNLDPPRVLGYLHDSRGRRELRADRILALLPLGDELT